MLIKELAGKEIEVRYDAAGNRLIKHYQETIIINKNKEIPLRKKGVYLITGGAGGLGFIFARYLAEHYQAKLILTGRSTLKEKQQNIITELEKLGSEVLYEQANVANKKEMKKLYEKIKSRFGMLHGVIHSAGVIRDALLVNKTQAEMAEVLSPKISGTINLDKILQKEPLDFFVMFSSTSAIFGNIGQCDYAYANGFMDGYASLRGPRYAKLINAKEKV